MGEGYTELFSPIGVQEGETVTFTDIVSVADRGMRECVDPEGNGFHQ
jgi:hypothetical protein